MSTPDPSFYEDWRDWADAYSKDLDDQLAKFGQKERTGRLGLFHGTEVAPGYLLCDGSTFLADSYPALAQFLGSTTLPNLASPLASSVVGIKT